jgi:hypothetical protein
MNACEGDADSPKGKDDGSSEAKSEESSAGSSGDEPSQEEITASIKRSEVRRARWLSHRDTDSDWFRGPTHHPSPNQRRRKASMSRPRRTRHRGEGDAVRGKRVKRMHN